MAKMSQQDFCSEVRRHISKPDVPMAVVEDVVKGMQAVLVDLLRDGKEVQFSIGMFKPVKKAARTMRNPQTQEQIEVPAKNGMRFKPGKRMTDALNT